MDALLENVIMVRSYTIAIIALISLVTLFTISLIRTLMAQAATSHQIEPRTISFKGAKQTLEAFQPVLTLQRHACTRE